MNMDLTDLLAFVSPGSFSRVKRWADDGSDLWDFTSAASIQASLDACVTWGDGVTPPTGQAVFDKMAEFTADQAAKAAAAADAKRILTPSRFAYLLASTGLEQVWKDVEAYCKVNDAATYALLKAHGAATEFRLTKTLTTLASLKPLTDSIAPDVDLSEATIRTEWAAAEAAVIGSLL